jgi:hypothetical protein
VHLVEVDTPTFDHLQSRVCECFYCSMSCVVAVAVVLYGGKKDSDSVVVVVVIVHACAVCSQQLQCASSMYASACDV